MRSVALSLCACVFILFCTFNRPFGNCRAHFVLACCDPRMDQDVNEMADMVKEKRISGVLRVRMT
jgi:hypothetical protein